MASRKVSSFLSPLLDWAFRAGLDLNLLPLLQLYSLLVFYTSAYQNPRSMRKNGSWDLQKLNFITWLESGVVFYRPQCYLVLFSRLCTPKRTGPAFISLLLRLLALSCCIYQLNINHKKIQIIRESVTKDRKRLSLVTKVDVVFRNKSQTHVTRMVLFSFLFKSSVKIVIIKILFLYAYF